MVARAGCVEDFDKRVYFGEYHPYRNADGQKNPGFDRYSGLLLDLKEGKPAALRFFAEKLEGYVEEGVPIVIVPSHDPNKTESGLRSVAQTVADHGRIDCTGCLVRTIKIDKLAHGGNRSVEVHLNSIEVEDVDQFEGMEVLLVDDIMTSGNSLIACKKLLEDAGALRVQMFAMGLTVR